jgi:hypothetical protein
VNDGRRTGTDHRVELAEGGSLPLERTGGAQWKKGFKDHEMEGDAHIANRDSPILVPLRHRKL